MRKVKVLMNKGMGKFNEKPEYKEGKFHQWGTDISTGGETNYAYTIGIVELENGKIICVEPDTLQFLPSAWDEMVKESAEFITQQMEKS